MILLATKLAGSEPLNSGRQEKVCETEAQQKQNNWRRQERQDDDVEQGEKRDLAMQGC